MEQNNIRFRSEKSRTHRIFVAGLAVMAILCLYVLISSAGSAGSYEIESQIAGGIDTAAGYKIMPEGMIRYSKDGASMTHKNGEVIWNKAYNMASPICKTNGLYAVVAEFDGNAVYVFDGQDQCGEMDTALTIQDVVISSQGVVAAMLSDHNGNMIKLYDKTGTKELAEIKASMEVTGYPLAMALADDASHLVVSYITIGSGQLSTNLAFYDFTNVNGTQEMGSIQVPGLIARLVFLDQTRVMAVGENGFYIYSIGDKVEEAANVTFESEIAGYFNGGQKSGFLFRSSEEGARYQCRIYDLTGNVTAQFPIDMEYDDISVCDYQVIFYDGHEMAFYDFSGKLEFAGTFEQNVYDVMPSWDSGWYWVVGDNALSEIRIK